MATSTIQSATKIEAGNISYEGTYVNPYGCFVKRCNNIIMLSLAISSVNTIIPVGAWTKVMNLPEGFRTNNDFTDNRVNTDGHYFGIRFNTNGDVEIYNYQANTMIDGAYLFTFIK